MNRTSLLQIGAALALGLGLRFVVNLEPHWWLAWLLPGLVLALALRADTWTSRGLVAIAVLLGLSANLTYYLRVMPLLPTMIVLLLQTLLWVVVVSESRRVMQAPRAAWTALAFPVFWVAADTLLAQFTPDGNWGSLAYTQVDLLPMAQLAALFGVGGILFVLALFNGALAWSLTHGVRTRGAFVLWIAVFAVVGGSMAHGVARLGGTPPAGSSVTFGIASVDDYLDGPRSLSSRDVWAQYDAQVHQLANAGAKLVLLPEKIDVLASADAEARKAALSRLAAENKVWLVAGLGVVTDRERRNEAWWFAPDGRLVTNYLKHFMAPPEREFVSGSEYPVNDIDGVRYGVAICKDMHFARLGRAFGAREAAVMLVPAWDFVLDAELAANMTALRGVENGYAVVRASRLGLLSITDAYGRVVAVERSASMPGTTLAATVHVGARVPTLYTRIGDALGWLCVAAALALALWTRLGSGPKRRFGA
jgi:apolipoprotein N-acyltransferase